MIAVVGRLLTRLLSLVHRRKSIVNQFCLSICSICSVSGQPFAASGQTFVAALAAIYDRPLQKILIRDLLRFATDALPSRTPWQTAAIIGRPSADSKLFTMHRRISKRLQLERPLDLVPEPYDD
jgi:hypothetical protein